MIETAPVPACPVCDATTTTVLHRGLTDRVFGVAPGEWTLRECTVCGTARLDPRPADTAIGGLYASYYTHAAPEPNLAPGGVAGVLRALGNAHVNATLGYSVTPARAPGRTIGRALPPLAAIAERRIRGLPFVAGGRLLDVGCGNGLFVAEAAAAGWAAAGIDLDAAAVAAGAAAGLDLAMETLADRAAREPGSYDAVTSSHVIEHVPDLLVHLGQLRALIKPGGRLWIATPNLAANGHRRYGADWLHLDPPRHLVLFNHDSLARALGRAGFTDIRALRPVPDAGTVFAQSAVLAGQDRPSRASVLAADLSAQRDHRRGEEILLLAR